MKLDFMAPALIHIYKPVHTVHMLHTSEAIHLQTLCLSAGYCRLPVRLFLNPLKEEEFL